MEHLVKLLRDSYDLQEEKSEETAYWHLQKLRSEIKQLTLTDVVVSFYCGAEHYGGSLCETQCLGCDGFDRECNN